jgi:hypothetical protein
MARPTKYTEELAEQICEALATKSKGLNSICKDLKIAPSSVYLWLIEHEGFSERYARAREEQADLLADEIIEISDDESKDTLSGEHGEYPNQAKIARDRLRIDARKWKASKLAPKKYGDKMDVTSNGETVSSYVIGFKKTGDENTTFEE